jgi:hypothetical protein
MQHSGRTVSITRNGLRNAIPFPSGQSSSTKEVARDVWKHSPDTENVRRHLLDLLAQIEETPRVEYPIGTYRDEVAVWQLGGFRDQRAFSFLEHIASFDPHASTDCDDSMRRTRQPLVKAAQQAMAKKRGQEAGA